MHHFHGVSGKPCGFSSLSLSLSPMCLSLHVTEAKAALKLLQATQSEVVKLLEIKLLLLLLATNKY